MRCLIINFTSQYSNPKTLNLTVIKKFLKAFLDLFYPNLCVACNEALLGNEKYLCSYCIAEMPLTNFWKQKDNPVEQLFWGRVNVEQAASLFYFEKDSRYQNILHQLKYKGKRNIGIQLGRIFGYHLNNTNFSAIDFIIPVPLHKKRLRKRGYNQSDMIGLGLSNAMEKPLLNNCVSRVIHTKSQTKKNRYSRWLNVEGIFEINDPDKIKGKHILIVDDVVTTGSTIESMAQELLKIKDVRVSIITLAVA